MTSSLLHAHHRKRSAVARQITNKFLSSCRGCGSAIDAGTRVWWEKGRGIACYACGAGALSSAAANPQQQRPWPGMADHPQPSGSRAAPAASGTASADAAASPAGGWQALCEYLLSCITQEDTITVCTMEDAGQWLAVPGGKEELFAGTAPHLQLEGNTRAQDQLRYGWPVLVVTGKGDHQIIPLLVAEASIEVHEGEKLLSLDSDPIPNAALRESALDPATAIELESVLGDALREGSPLQEVVGRAADALGAVAWDVDGPLAEPSYRAGLQNCAIVQRVEGSNFTHRLRSELEQLRSRADWRTTAAAALIVDRNPAVASLLDAADVVAPLPLNDSQEMAVRRLDQPITVVTGPPGTGKSQLTTALVATCWSRGESVLIASTNNQAVDVAVSRCSDVHEVLALRTGSKAHREQLAAAAASLAQSAAKTTAHPSEVEYRHNKARAIAIQRSAEHARLEAISEAEIELLHAHAVSEVASMALFGQPAGPGQMSERSLSRLSVRAGRLARRTNLGWWRQLQWGRLRRQLSITTDAGPDEAEKWLHAQQRLLHAQAKLESAVVVPASPIQPADLDREWSHAWREYAVVAGRLAARTARSQLQRLAETATRPGLRELLTRKDLGQLKGWGSTALSVGATIPLEPGIVDVLIIDEASQCTIAHVLPLAYRAKRVYILGDPNQLTPVVTLSNEQAELNAERAGLTRQWLREHELTFTTSSAFHAFQRTVPDGPALLDEHYRCHPAIARWFSAAFYNNQLTVVSSDEGTGVSAVPVRGEAERGANGNSWQNSAEADAVVSQVLELADLNLSLGIVTPFSGQAATIRHRLQQLLGPERMHELFDNGAGGLYITTAHRFQGAERDIMILSSVVTPNMRHKTARWLEQERNLLNVAVSRARQRLILIGDPAGAESHGLRTWVSLWDAARTDRSAEPAPASALHSESERRLYAAMRDRGIELTPKLLVGPYELDFAIRTGCGLINIEVDGDQHLDVRGRQRRRDVARDQYLREQEWQVRRLPAWRVFSDADAVAVELITEFDLKPTEGPL